MAKLAEDLDPRRFGQVRDPMHRDVLETRDIAKEIRGLLDEPEADEDKPSTSEQILEVLDVMSNRMDKMEETLKLLLERDQYRTAQHNQLLAEMKNLNLTLSGLGKNSAATKR